MTENSKSEKNLVLRYSTHASQAYAGMRQGDDQAKVTVGPGDLWSPSLSPEVIGHLAFHRPAAMLLGSGERYYKRSSGFHSGAEVT